MKRQPKKTDIYYCIQHAIFTCMLMLYIFKVNLDKFSSCISIEGEPVGYDFVFCSFFLSLYLLHIVQLVFCYRSRWNGLAESHLYYNAVVLLVQTCYLSVSVVLFVKFKGWLLASMGCYVIMLKGEKILWFFFFQILNLLAERKQSCALKQ